MSTLLSPPPVRFLGKPSEVNRERIVSAAVRLFCEKGFEASSVREIVGAAGVSKPVLYYYFKNKDDLFRHIIEDSMKPFYETVIATCRRTDLDFWEKLKTVFDLHIQMATENPDLVRFLHAIAFSNLYRNVFDFEAYWVKTLRALGEAFGQAQIEGALRKDRTALFLARNFMGMTLSEIRSIVYCPEILENPPSGDEIVDLFRKGAAP